MHLTGKTAIVTGGSRGIGRAIALRLAEEGANVAVIYAGNTAAAEETQKAIAAQGGQSIAIQCDVANEEAVTAMVKQVKEQFGSVDILVNNAGITRDGLLMRMKTADWQAVLDTNLTGTFFCTKAVTKLMMKQRSGQFDFRRWPYGQCGTSQLCRCQIRYYWIYQVRRQRIGFPRHSC